MQRILIVLVVGLLAVGCATMKDIGVQLGIGQSNTPEQKQKHLRDSVVGEYEHKHDNGTTYKNVYLDNGIREWYENGKKQGEHKWLIVDGEIHAAIGSELAAAHGVILVFSINKDKSITLIAYMDDGKRTDHLKENQYIQVFI